MVAKKQSTAAKAAQRAAPDAQPGPAPVKRAAAEQPKRAAAGKTAAVKRVDGKKAAAGKRAPAGTAAKRSAPAKAGKAAPAEVAGETTETGVRNVVAKKSTGTSRARKTATAATSGLPKARGAAELAVRPGEDPWSPAEVTEARTELEGEVLRLRSELDASELAITGLMRDGGGGAGDDEADTGSKNITREHEIALAANAREMLEQTQRALERLDAGTYGLCENCGRPIGKARMQAFPRATLCVECKQKQERRH
ncbi:DNA-binding protein [Streptomyces venezuelae]|uniref:DNA-binding protein n=1 Tax=Streptomyces venezuelae TaxID=54571 RepID=A0A5P2D5U9_STRVZ|nr:TraR/DksA C4-type zinc finger protein [Streptomyces venezuelae]QES50562.1 DNA-binding protein [Streptomyces venezuelae]